MRRALIVSLGSRYTGDSCCGSRVLSVYKRVSPCVWRGLAAVER